MAKIPTERRRRETAAHIAALTVANALIFQEELAAANQDVRPLRSLLGEPDIITALAAHWQFICESINYVPIFHLARQVLLAVPALSGADKAVRILVRQALEIVSRRAALRHDLMGRVFHYLLLDAKYLGTFYTSVPAATLLLKLALAPRHSSVNWAKLEDIRELQIADLACGTGTLLMAASQAMTDNYVRAVAKSGGRVDEPKLRSLHKTLIEDVLHAYDVLPSAVHLTASTLALLAPEIAFRKMELYCLPLGRQDDRKVYLGSIEYLHDKVLKSQLDLMGAAPAGGAASAITGTGVAASTAPLPKLDLCVMNPPFTRSVGGNLLFGSLPDQRGEMQKKLRDMLNPSRGPAVLASSTAGLGSVFTAVADRHLKDRGRLALVLPAATTTGVAWEKTRTLLANGYVLEFLVASHDPERWNFSENTDLSEVLLVARKGKTIKGTRDVETVCVNLWENPRTAAAGLAVADAILSTAPGRVGEGARARHGTAPLMIGARKMGEAIAIPWRDLREGPWIGCAFAQTDLVRAAWGLRRGYLQLPGHKKLFTIPLKSLSDLGELGPDRRDIYDGFTQSRTKTAYRALWGHSADEIKTLDLQPNAWLEPRVTPEKGRKIRDITLLWPKAGRVMVAERMWF